MRKLILLLVMISGVAINLMAFGKCDQQRLTPEEFRARQKAYITEKAGLTQEEAAKFFPVYFELQDQKKQLNDEAWKLIRQGDGECTEAQYEEILQGVYDARISVDRLEKTYFEKFRKILSCKKLYLVEKAEMKFHRELLKGMHPNRRKGAPVPPQKKQTK